MIIVSITLYWKLIAQIQVWRIEKIGICGGRIIVKDKKDRGNKAVTGMALGMAIGMSLGTALGAAIGNIGMYMPMGLSAGMCLGLAVGSAVKNNDNDDDDEGEE